MKKSELLSIYIHTPFCESRCSYCDFNTYVGYESSIDNYVSALIKESLILSKKIKPDSITHTVYFGGGTPTLLRPQQVESIIGQLHVAFNIRVGAEMTMEANPCSINSRDLSNLRKLGINRLSIGMQSAHENELMILGRRHSYYDVVTAVNDARRLGFENINLDIIFGFPTQTLKSFQNTLRKAIELDPNHISLYALTLEDDKPLAKMIKNKEVEQIDEDEAADMYEMAIDYLPKWGYDQYEISNWARDDAYQCQHNLQYWKNLAYIGLGCGAHSHYNNQRWENILTIPEYINKINLDSGNTSELSPVVMNCVTLTIKEQMQETIMMGMRMTQEGLNIGLFNERFDVDFFDVYKKEIEELLINNFIEFIKNQEIQCIRLTKKGRLLGNHVFRTFLSDNT